MKTMHNVSLVNVIPFANPHPYDLSCSPKGIHCSELTHTCAHTHTPVLGAAGSQELALK